MLGAGSAVFSKNLTGDILSYPLLSDAELVCVDIDPQRLELARQVCQKVAQSLGANPKITATLDRASALAGADFVINTVAIGGFDSTLIDFEIPRKYGLRFTIADTTGPGGIFRALRTYPFLRDLSRQMLELCPNAWLLNYTNPMSMNMRALACLGIERSVGLCHSIQGTINQIAWYLQINASEIDFLCAGINHMAFFLKLLHNGQDLYPRLFEAAGRKETFHADAVRFELLRRLGYFVTESSEHNAEYNAHFIPHGPEVIARFFIPLDEYLRRCQGAIEEIEKLKTAIRSREPLDVSRSQEYAGPIISALRGGDPVTIYGNLPNHGAISNLPSDAIVETPTKVDQSGMKLTPVGDLPPQLVGYVQPHLIQHELFLRAVTEGRRDHVYQAAMFDPLTAAVLTPDQIVEMCDQLIAAHGPLLPPLDSKKSLVPCSGKQFPPIDAVRLRRLWQADETRMDEFFLTDWHIVGPFQSPRRGSVSLDLWTPVEHVPTNRPDGWIDLAGAYALGRGMLKWTPAHAAARGFVDLDTIVGRHEWSVAYAYAEFESDHRCSATLTCGSDDGIRVWLNGQVVHEREIGRTYRPHDDRIPVKLKKGPNRILVKIDNCQGGWGFGIAIIPANHVGDDPKADL
jgi:alpha-galactosidase